MSSLRRSEEKQNIVKDEVPCFVTERSSSKDATKPENREAVIAFRGNTKAEPRAEHTTPSNGLGLEKEPETPDLFTLEEFLQSQSDEKP